MLVRDKKRIISGSRDTTIRIWDVEEGICTGVFTNHTETVRKLVLSSAEDRLLSGSYDGTSCVWSITNEGLECLHTLRGHEGAIYCIAFVGNGDSRVVTGGADATVRLWDIDDG